MQDQIVAREVGLVMQSSCHGYDTKLKSFGANPKLGVILGSSNPKGRAPSMPCKSKVERGAISIGSPSTHAEKEDAMLR